MSTSFNKHDRYLALSAAVVLCFSVLTTNVFATTGEMPPAGANITTGQTGIDPVPSDVEPPPPSSETPSQTDPETPSSSIEPSEPETPSSSVSEPNEEPSSSVSSKKPQNNNNQSRQPSSSKSTPVAPPKGVASVAEDSRKPTDFSNEDLNGLLSGSASSLPSTDGFLREEDSNNSSGGISSLFLGGIALILLGLAGVLLFVYRQFIVRKRRPSTATGPLPAISTLPVKKNNPPQKLSSQSTSGTPAPAPQPQPKPEAHAPEIPKADADSASLPSGQFTDISSGRTPGPDRDGFDWDKFFKNIPSDDSDPNRP